jgi:hypothetical protein
MPISGLETSRTLACPRPLGICNLPLLREIWAKEDILMFMKRVSVTNFDPNELELLPRTFFLGYYCFAFCMPSLHQQKKHFTPCMHSLHQQKKEGNTLQPVCPLYINKRKKGTLCNLYALFTRMKDKRGTKLDWGLVRRIFYAWETGSYRRLKKNSYLRAS